ASSVASDRPDPAPPGGPLLRFGRRQDLAFERDVGRSARERNHVRLWRTDLRAHGDRAVWIGAATFDRGVGLSHTTAQITHHIAPDIDVERDTLMRDLDDAGQLTTLYAVTGVGPTLDGRNGGAHPHFPPPQLHLPVLAPAPP